MEELNGLVAEAKLNADPTSAYMRDCLFELYKNACPHSPQPEIPGKEWKELGFQVICVT